MPDIIELIKMQDCCSINIKFGLSVRLHGMSYINLRSILASSITIEVVPKESLLKFSNTFGM